MVSHNNAVPQRLVLIATLDVRRAAEAQFRRYEAVASEIMKTYGGRIERVVAVEADPGPGLFSEVHIVSFPGHADFDAYRRDERLQEWRETRAQAIARTVIVCGADKL